MECSKELLPLYPIIYTPWYLQRVTLVIGIILFLSILIFLLFLLYKKRRIVKSPEGIFLALLDILEKNKNNSNAKEFYTLFMSAVKKYMSFLSGVELASFTEQELILFVDTERSSLTAESRVVFKELLQHAQTIKFSSKTETSEFFDTALELGRALIPKKEVR